MKNPTTPDAYRMIRRATILAVSSQARLSEAPGRGATWAGIVFGHGMPFLVLAPPKLLFRGKMREGTASLVGLFGLSYVLSHRPFVVV